MSFKAKYDGICSECKEPIYKDDELDWVDKQVVHADCLQDALKEHVDRPTCPKCWQVLSVAGACGCDPE